MKQLVSLLQQHFGYNEFRGRQEEIITHTLNGHDSLVIMPTGGGKSLCYQLPALARPGTAIVISPLISLMQDQVDALLANGIPAAALNSTVMATEVAGIAEQIGSERLKLLYVSPERATQTDFIDLVRDRNISLIAVDESHCVSIWGNDFRKDYVLIPRLLEAFGNVPVMALTATADKLTQDDITEKLQLDQASKFIESFERPNLTIRVLPANGRTEQVIKYITSHLQDAGIIYCLSRKSTEKVSQRLNELGISSAYYHADLGLSERQRVQRAFQTDEIKVICATIAFGMGIDKSNVRYVIHYNLPKNLESYYQEIGRAGRDGLPAETILYYSMGDAMILRKFIDNSEADASFKAVQRRKLNRIIDYGQAASCRTNLILSYFGEHRLTPCGHCDNCLSPPETFDGTVLAQKALSAVKRMREKGSITMVADVLRGSNKESLRRMNFHKIKTYGAGKDVSRDDWVSYLSQMVNMGVFEMDLNHYNTLKVTPSGEQVLYGKAKIRLARSMDLVKNDTKKSPVPSGTSDQDLFEKLRSLRKVIAHTENVPPYVIFHDATLLEMSDKKPVTLAAMSQLTGIGTFKLNKYGQAFIDAIENQQKNMASHVQSDTFQQTLSMYREGHSPEQIAEKRNLSPGTIYSHILKLYTAGEEINLLRLIDEKQIEEIRSAKDSLQEIEKLSQLHDHLEGKFSYDQIKLALAYRG